MRKRSFLLLEVLIAFLLVTICAVPLVQQPLKFYKSEIEYLKKMEEERLADWTFTEIKEMLLRNDIPWKKIPLKGEASGPFPLPDALLNIPNCKLKPVQRRFILHGRGVKIGLHDEEYRQLNIEIFINHHSYKFRLPVQKRCV